MGTRICLPWADLPQDLLSIIANGLTSNPIDVCSFRAVCKSWNVSSPSASPYILSVMLPLTAANIPYTFDPPRFFNNNFGLPIISVTSVFALHHHGQFWLMFGDQLTPGKIMIRQPFTRRCYNRPINFPSYLDVTNIHVNEIGRFYNLNFHSDVKKPPCMWSQHVQKVVVSSDESVAYALFYTGQLGASKLNIPYWMAISWEPRHEFDRYYSSEPIDDIVNYNGKTFWVDRVGRLYDGSHMIQTNVPSFVGSSTKCKRLVESNGLLHLVIRGGVSDEGNGGVIFKVFELDEDLEEWVEVSSMGGMIFFFGLDFSFSVSPEDLGGSFGKDCILYQQSSFRDYDDGVVDDVILFSNLTYRDLRIGVWHIKDPCHCGIIGSYPGYSDVLWPPPTWLWSVDMSKRIENLEIALDDLFMNAPAEKLKWFNAHAISKELRPLEQAIIIDDTVNQQDVSEIWKVAHTIKVYLNLAKEAHKNLEQIKTNAASKKQPNESINLHDQIGSSSRGTEDTDDAFLVSELNRTVLHLEETTSKLQSTLKSREQPSLDAVKVESDIGEESEDVTSDDDQ